MPIVRFYLKLCSLVPFPLGFWPRFSLRLNLVMTLLFNPYFISHIFLTYSGSVAISAQSFVLIDLSNSGSDLAYARKASLPKALY